MLFFFKSKTCIQTVHSNIKLMFVTYLPAYFFLGEGDFALIQQLREQRLFWLNTHYILRARRKAEDEKKDTPEAEKEGVSLLLIVIDCEMGEGARVSCMLPPPISFGEFSA